FAQGDNWTDLKRRYPIYFWPQLVLEEILKSANQKQIKRIRETVMKIKNKTSLLRKIDRLIKSGQNSHTL
ncbi:MAG: hypothetical protein AAB871_02020, partial [Patescibacteria group bacterium]